MTVLWPYKNQIIEKLEKVFDTDVELDVYNLGLIYEINIDETGLCKIVMTSPILPAIVPKACLLKSLQV